MQLDLVGSPLCPFSLRAVITLIAKDLPFELRTVDLFEKPDWLRKMSPHGSVPVLLVDRRFPIFESEVICEFCDELTFPRLQPGSPVKRAEHRAWIQYGSERMWELYQWLTCRTEGEWRDVGSQIMKNLLPVERQVGAHFFSGEEAHLIDLSWAPFFVWLNYIEKRRPLDFFWEKLPQTRAWAQTLLVHSAVIRSIPKNFDSHLTHFLAGRQALIAQREPNLLVG